MESAATPTGRVPAVGRGNKMRTAVLAATLAELATTGYAGLTVEGVAQRAGVHKTTVYRNWKDAPSLVVDALTSHFATDIPIPDTGSVAGDLRALAQALVASVSTQAGRALITTVLAEAARLPRLADVKRALSAELLKTLAAPIYFRLVCTGEPVDEGTADRAARVALAAAHARALPAV